MAQNKYGYVTRNIKFFLSPQAQFLLQEKYTFQNIILHIDKYSRAYLCTICTNIVLYNFVYLYSVINVSNYDYHNSKMFNNYHKSTILFLFYKEI